MTRTEALLEAIQREVAHRRPEIEAHPEEAVSYMIVVKFPPRSTEARAVVWSKQAER